MYTLLSVALGRYPPGGQLLANITVFPPYLFQIDMPVLAVGWSLAFEFAFYLIIAAAIHCRRPITAFCCIITTFAGIAIIAPVPSGTLAVFANPIQLEFLWGAGAYVLYRFLVWHNPSRFAGVFLIAAGAFVLLLQAIHGQPFNADALYILSSDSSLIRAMLWGLPWAFITTGYVLVAPYFSSSSRSGQRLLRITGEGSYSLYLVHLPICLLVEILLPTDAIQPDLLIGAVFLISWVVGMVTHKWIERPLLKALAKSSPKRINSTQPSQPAPSAQPRSLPQSRPRP